MFKPHTRSGPTFAGQRIGLLGGSFNPAHAGHYAMSLHALNRLKLDQVWWLVSPQNPLKSSRDMQPLTERVKKAEAVALHGRIRVTILEDELNTRYTIDTLRALKKRFSRTHFVWLMGADNLVQMPRWRQWQAIFNLVPVAVFRRPAYAAGRGLGKVAQRFHNRWLPISKAKLLADAEPPAWLVLDNRLNDLSATKLRKKLLKG